MVPTKRVDLDDAISPDVTSFQAPLRRMPRTCTTFLDRQYSCGEAAFLRSLAEGTLMPVDLQREDL
jgi:hypothetical protein